MNVSILPIALCFCDRLTRHENLVACLLPRAFSLFKIICRPNAMKDSLNMGITRKDIFGGSCVDAWGPLSLYDQYFVP